MNDLHIYTPKNTCLESYLDSVPHGPSLPEFVLRGLEATNKKEISSNKKSGKRIYILYVLINKSTAHDKD